MAHVPETGDVTSTTEIWLQSLHHLSCKHTRRGEGLSHLCLENISTVPE